MYKKYKIGTYSQKQLNNKRKYIRKLKHNKTYAGTLTKRRKEINENRAVVFLLVSFLFGATYAFAMTSNNFTINGNSVEAKAETRLFVEPQVEEDYDLLVTSSAVVSIEQQIRDIAKEHNFKWTDYLVNLACCEGLLKTDTINIAGNYPVGSRDRGLYGINDYWHAEVSDEVAKDLRASTEWTINHINNGMQHEWMCDPRIKGISNYAEIYCGI